MLRPLYRCVVRLHPPGFRGRFGEEMLSIFDHTSGRLDASRLLLDGLVSLALQWTARSEFWSDIAPAQLQQTVSDGVPSFVTLNPFRPRIAAIIQGLIFSTAVFCLTCFAIKYSWIHVLHVHIPEIQFESAQWIPPRASESESESGRPVVSQEQSTSPADSPNPPPSVAPSAAHRSSNAPAQAPAPVAAQNRAAPTPAPLNSTVQNIPTAFPASRLRDSTNPAAVATGVPSAIADNSNLDAAARRRVIEGAVANLEQYYVYPDTAKKMADALRSHENQGDNNDARDGETFAKRLTMQMRNVSHDQHLMVAYSGVELSPGGLGSTPEELARYRKEMQRTHCTFERVAILPHNIGYLKLNSFPDPSTCQPTAAAAMASLNQADAIIFDLRDNHGGSPSMVALMASYLFEHPTHLDDLYNRADASTLQSWTLSPVVGNKLANKPAYVLTSTSTFSGAEEFAYDLKLLKRATVVGETTAGAAHMLRRHRIDDHFSIGVPDTRPINPISNTDWEGTGVTPDVSVKADDALKTAEDLAHQAMQKK